MQAAQTTTTGELPSVEPHACASRPSHAYRCARPHGFVRNRWYPAAKCDAKVEWDFEDRLVKVTKSDGTVVENVYDVDGVLVRTAVNGVGVDYLVDTSGGLSHVVAEVDSSGAVSALYVRAGDMLLEEVRGGVAKMYETDGLGSVRGLLDVSGAKTDTYAYEAFGSTISSTGSDANPYRFAGERLVDSVGFYQNRARWLDTRTGRFVSADSVDGQDSRPLTLQRYTYGQASPVSVIDPTGCEYTISGMVTVGLVGAALNVAIQHPKSPRQIVDAAITGFTVGMAVYTGLGALEAIGSHFAAVTAFTSAAAGATQVLTPAERLAENSFSGKSFELALAGWFRDAGYEVYQQVRVMTPYGERVYDLVVYRGGQLLGTIEAKVGAAAYDNSQRLKDEWLLLMHGVWTNVVRVAKWPP